MKAAQINKYGGKDVLQVVADASKPVAGKGQVLVEVHAAGINPFDWKVREGYAQQMAQLEFPATLGGDFAGVVTELGEGVTELQVGDEVYGQTNPLSGLGSFAEYTPVRTKNLALKPKSLDFAQAAAAPLAAASAYQALVENIELQGGQTILIHGGSGGIGTFAVQLAKHLGAHVITTVATDNVEYATSLGADEVIDYKTQAFETIAKDVDAVFDTVGGETYTKSFQTLKQGGMLVSMVEQPNEELAAQYGVTSLAQATQATAGSLKAIAELFEDGALTVHIDRTFSLDETADALEYVREGKHRGKVVLTVK